MIDEVKSLKILTSRAYAQHSIFIVTYDWAKKARVFVPSRPNKPILALLPNSRRGWRQTLYLIMNIRKVQWKKGRYDTHFNDIQHNDTQHNLEHCCDQYQLCSFFSAQCHIQLYKLFMLCHYVECHYTECHYAECHWAK